MLRHIVLSTGGQLDPGSIVKRDEVFTPVIYMDPTSDKVEMWNLLENFLVIRIFKRVFLAVPQTALLVTSSLSY